MKTSLTILILLLLSVATPLTVKADNSLRSRSAAANLLYVAPTGNDANACTSVAQPCSSINGALGKAAAGATIKVAIGTYQYGTANASQNSVVSITQSVNLLGG